MKRGTYLRTPEILKKMSISNQGNIPWSKGKISEATKKAMTPEVRGKMNLSKRGKPLSEEHRKAISL